MDGYFQNKKRQPLFLRVLWVLFILAMLLNSAALVLSYLSTTLDPYIFWYVAFLGLGAPILMLINVICLLVLGIKLSKWAFVPLVTLVLGVGYIGDFVQFSFMSKYNKVEEKKHKNEISILSYNVHSFSQYGEKNRSTLDDILSFVGHQNPDIICIQEFQLRNKQDSAVITQKLTQWKYHAVSSVIRSGDYRWGLAIFSKLPLRNAKSIKFSDRTNSAMCVDMIVGTDTVRLFNSHLQSTQFNKLSRKKLEAGDPEDAARLVGSTLRQNYKIRTFQADTLASIIHKSPYPVIVVGDFNDTPMSYVYHTIKGDMKDAFREKGSGYEYSYIPFKKIFRIDYILHSENIEALSYDSPLIKWSDHKPVISRMKINPKR